MDGGLDDPLVRMHRWDALRQRLANSAAGRLGPVVDEVIEAVATVLHRHAPVTVTLIVEGSEARTTAQLAWHEGQLVVARTEPQPLAASGTGAGAGQPAETSEETAARLADLIRQDPSLLDGRDQWGGPRADA
jgi:hypothetical protein